MAETENIGKMAELVSQNLLSFFKWETIALFNSNFECLKPPEHAKSNNAKSHTHPVDVVFHYLDPYTNKRVLFNTDLKSYKEGSITESNVRTALKSLAKTIECARMSKEWQNRFANFSEPADIRALLFTYNHDGQFDRNFYDRFFIKKKSDPSNKRVINTSSIALKRNQLLHIIEPSQICYLNTIVNDLNALAAKQKLPPIYENKHWFYYPELFLHKTHYDKYQRAATIEMLSSPVLIIGHDEVTHNSELKEPAGFIIYYHGRGETQEEFIYLLDTISRHQMLDSSCSIKIRCTSFEKHKDITSTFKNAVSSYATAWGYDEHKKKRLKEIENNFETVTQYKELLSDIDVGWRS
ncbi:hypothetical protein I6F50_05180 [Pseudoalteromonas sp. NZS127_1]|uniref:hypothetical protein n=1 Tax=Pseudoalteromonas sp. NZS127_1 TaxID=2792074 RepID=UPI0018CE411D|nr:hypothetical protein [Pseudoalteromonas sp. NZS127_1]MBG9994447.1 hypothetical protein [Pseudoalteromonas sp. NZS127_1]